MRTKLLTYICSVFVVVSLGGDIARAAKWNEKIYNKSPHGAYDLTFILRGRKKISVICSNKGTFKPSVSYVTYQGQPCTKVTWTANPPSNYIRPGGFGHFGIADPSCCAERINTAYWTDLQGNRIHGSVVFKPSKKKIFKQIIQNQKEVTVRFINEIHDPCAVQRDITLTNIRYRIYDEEIPLDALNEENSELNDSLLLAHAGPLVVPPDETVDVKLPEYAEPGQWIVVRFENTAPEVGDSSATVVTDWMEFLVEQPPPGYYTGKSVYNFGPEAYGLTILVEPAIRVIEHVDDGFDQFSAQNIGTRRTKLQWSERPAPPLALPTSDMAHVVWVADKPHKVVDAWWTDGIGGRIPSSIIYNLTTEGFYNRGQYRIKFTNTTQPTDPAILPAPIHLSYITYNIERKEGILSKHLNYENRELMAALELIEAGPITLAPGEAIELQIPESVQLSDWVNVVSMSTVASSPTISQVIDFVQVQAALRADFNYDGIVDFKDLAVLAREWLQLSPP